MLRRLLALAATPALAAGAVMLAAPAGATTANPAPAAQAGYVVQQVNPTTYVNPVSKKIPAILKRAAPYKICTNSSPQRCMTAEGNGFQFQMQLSGYSTFSSIQGPDGSLFETPNSLCPQAKDAANAWVVIGNAVCTSTNKSDEWVVSNRLESAAYSGRYLSVLFNNQDGARTTTQLGTGAYYLGLYFN